MQRDLSAVSLKWTAAFGGRIMFDFEEAEFFFEAEKRKRKKDKKHKTGMTAKTPENIQKKKKKKTKEETKKKKQKKKEKQKRGLPLELDGGLVFKESNSARDTFFDKLEASKPDHLTPDSKKKSKRKNKVAFDALPHHIRIKRPKFASSFIKEKEPVRAPESCSQAAVTGNSPDQDSQCTSDDISSQDLFITQKTFRKSLPGPSRGEASYRALTASPLLQTQQGNSQHPLLVEMKQLHEESGKWPQDSQSHQLCKPSNPEEAEEDEGLHKLHKKKKAFLTQNTSISCPVGLKHSVGNPFLDEPVIVKSWEVAEKTTGPPNQRSPSSLPHINESQLPAKPTVSSSTQTENFFTAELSSYLRFCQKRRPTARFEDLKPLDLSMTQRARKDLGSCLSVPEVKNKTGGTASSDSSHVKGKRVPSAQSETTLSLQLSESDQKSADTMTSSEDSEPPGRTGKLDLIQVRAVQMRLNESFFFKTKGERKSPRPESPLMKLAQGRGVKNKKGC